jgi:hypothetical protein
LDAENLRFEIDADTGVAEAEADMPPLELEAQRVDFKRIR